MNYKTSFYVLLTVFIISSLCLWAYHIIDYDKNRVDNNSVKIKFDPGYNCGPSEFEYFKMKRVFKNYNLGSDTINNLKTLQTVKNELNSLKHAYDSTHGIRISFTNDTPYKNYLELVKICLEKEPKYFFPEESSIYAIAKSRYEMKEDSLADTF